MFSQTKAISEESLIDKLIELNISKTETKSLGELITELDDTELLQRLFQEESEEESITEDIPQVSSHILIHFS